MKFEKLELKSGENWIKRLMINPHFKKTLLFVLIGGVAGFAFYYFTEGIQMDKMPTGEIFQSIAAGAFLGFFITNSPCTRDRC